MYFRSINPRLEGSLPFKRRLASLWCRVLTVRAGPVSEVHVPIDKETKKSKAFAFITFLQPEDAIKAYVLWPLSCWRARAHTPQDPPRPGLRGHTSVLRPRARVCVLIAVFCGDVRTAVGLAFNTVGTVSTLSIIAFTAHLVKHVLTPPSPVCNQCNQWNQCNQCTCRYEALDGKSFQGRLLHLVRAHLL